MMYLFVYVPVAGRIAPAAARNRIGPLSVRSTSKGSPVLLQNIWWPVSLGYSSPLDGKKDLQGHYRK